ncbi:MAG: ankyrin repeat domain-containing protein, partial [Gemmatimonadota bacterium]|nr:ankyrin repeat domain-containing protein [Gemmatimonadota bacterium]
MPNRRAGSGRLHVNAWVGLALASLALAGSAPESPVADAAMEGRPDLVRALVADGADVNAGQGDGMTALHWAARHGDAALASFLLEAGARVDAITRIGHYQPLHLAAEVGAGEVVRA